jgi:cytochrome b involved in lipid metabolism
VCIGFYLEGYVSELGESVRALAIVLVILMVCCTSSTTPGDSNTNPPNESDSVYTLEDLEEARLRGECWTAINGNVYNITEFVAQHPGGNIISDDCGIDATVLFETRPMGSGTPHSIDARTTLEKYYIGRFRTN